MKPRLIAAMAALSTATACTPPAEQEFRVVSTSPTRGVEDAPVACSISITFNAAVDPATITNQTVRVWVSVPGEPTVSGTLAADGPRVTFTPDAALDFGSYYKVDLSGIRDDRGRTAPAYRLEFRTAIGDFDFSTPLPRFVSIHYVTPGDIAGISRFRSGVGHDYSDDFETCRSMKHYLDLAALDWTAVEVRSPVWGRIVERYDEWAGTKLVIRSHERPAFFFEIFHVALSSPLVIGDVVQAGQILGHHASSSTFSDVAVSVATTVDGPNLFMPGRRYVSYFDVMTAMPSRHTQPAGLPARSS